MLSDYERRISHAAPVHYESLRSAERRVPMIHFDYLYNLMSLLRNPSFRLHRHDFVHRDGVGCEVITSSTGDYADVDRGTPDALLHDGDGDDDDDEGVALMHDNYMMVNAYYDPRNHRIVMPPGILMPPSFAVFYNEIG